MPELENTQKPVTDDPQGVGARVLREIIRTPAFREIVRMHMDAVDPAAARAIVGTLMSEDINLSLSMASASPALVNYTIEAVLEIGRRLDRFAPEMSKSFIEEISSQIDTDRLKQIPEVYGPLIGRMLTDDPELKRSVLAGFIEAVNKMTAVVNEALEKQEQQPAKQLLEDLPKLDTAALGRAVTLSVKAANRSLSSDSRIIEEIVAGIDFMEVLKLGLKITRAIVGGLLKKIGGWFKRK